MTGRVSGVLEPEVGFEVADELVLLVVLLLVVLLLVVLLLVVLLLVVLLLVVLLLAVLLLVVLLLVVLLLVVLLLGLSLVGLLLGDGVSPQAVRIRHAITATVSALLTARRMLERNFIVIHSLYFSKAQTELR